MELSSFFVSLAKKSGKTDVLKHFFVILQTAMRKIALMMAVATALSVSAAEENNSTSKGQYYRLFVPLTFYHSVAQSQLSIDCDSNANELNREVNDALMHVYLNRPDLVQGTESEMAQSGQLRTDLEKPIEQRVAIVDEVVPMPEVFPEADSIEVMVEKPQFWKYKGDGYLQFMQNYVSGNWYKGGESNYAAVGSVTLEAN